MVTKDSSRGLPNRRLIQITILPKHSLPHWIYSKMPPCWITPTPWMSLWLLHLHISSYFMILAIQWQKDIQVGICHINTKIVLGLSSARYGIVKIMCVVPIRCQLCTCKRFLSIHQGQQLVSFLWWIFSEKPSYIFISLGGFFQY